jgi:hypothetical protein
MGFEEGGSEGVLGVLGADDDDVSLEGAAGELPPPHAAANSTTATQDLRVQIRKRPAKTLTFSCPVTIRLERPSVSSDGVSS